MLKLTAKPGRPAPDAQSQAEDGAEDPIARLNDRLRPVSMAGLAVFVGFFVILLGWAAVAPLASAAFANGMVEIEGKRKTVQHKEGGVVKAVLVREGQAVEAGEPVILLDDTQPRALHALLLEQQRALKAQIARLEAELSDADTVTFPEDLLADAAGDPAVQRLIDGQRETFEARRTLMQSQLETFEQRRRQLVEQIGSFRAQIESKQRQIALLRDELKGVRELQQKGHAPMTRVRALERAMAALEGEVGEYQGRIAQAQENDAELEAQIAALLRSRVSEAAEKLPELRSQLYALGERLVATGDILDRTVIRAPTSGRVLGLNVHTVGGVVNPAQPLMDIVPDQKELVVKAALPTTAIDDVHTGMEAEVTFNAFSSRFTERILGRIVNISADAKENREAGQLFYELVVVVPEEELKKLGEGVELQPGMPVTVKVVTGSRSALSYFVRPITRTFDKAFTES